jgi:hypothetical protein
MSDTTSDTMSDTTNDTTSDTMSDTTNDIANGNTPPSVVDSGTAPSTAVHRTRRAARDLCDRCLDAIRAAARRDRLLRDRRLPALATLGAIATLQGCVAVGGARHLEQPTVGKQLLDLKAALDAGAISQQEFDGVKARILAEKP